MLLRKLLYHGVANAPLCNLMNVLEVDCDRGLNRVHFGTVGLSSWLGILPFPYEDLGWNKAFSDQCYELIISAGTRRLRICAI